MNTPTKCPICGASAIRSSSGILLHTAPTGRYDRWGMPVQEPCKGSTPGAKVDQS